MPKKLLDQPTPATTRESERFVLRFPDGLRELVVAEAQRNGRSINSEIVARLQDSFDPSKNVTLFANEVLAQMEAMNREAEARIKEEEERFEVLKLEIAELAKKKR